MTIRDKRRDMARSVLPSTGRKAARDDKRAVHGRVRARVRDALRAGDWDDGADLLVDPQRDKPYQGIKEVVRERRSRDKVAPLMRWAEANADRFGATPAERNAALRAMLPQNLVGWHAMTHVEFIDAYDPNPWDRWWRRHREAGPTWNEQVDALAARLDARVHRHGELNRRLRSSWTLDRDGKPVSVRYWLGRHDSHDFARWVLHQPMDHRRVGRFDWRWESVGARAVVIAFADEPV